MSGANGGNNSSTSSSSSERLPQWRGNLNKIPKDELCGSQKDLLRAMELSDSLDAIFDGNKPMPEPTVASPDAPLTLFLSCLEILHLPIKDRSIFSRRSARTADKMGRFLLESAMLMADLATGASGTPSKIKPNDSTLALGIYNLIFSASFEVGRVEASESSNPPYELMIKGAMLAKLNFGNPAVMADNEIEIKRLQEKYGTQLNLKDLIEMSEVMHAELVLRAAGEGFSIPQTDQAAALEDFLASTERSTVSWYRCSKIYAFVSAAPTSSSLEDTRTINTRIEKIFHRYLDVAAKDDDPLRQAWATFDIALTKLSDAGWYYTELKASVDKGDELLAACKVWLPSYFRNIFMEGQEVLQKMLKAAQKMYPSEYKTRKLGMEVMFAIDPTEMDPFDLSDDAPRHMCSACEQESRTMKVCAGCKMVYYCNAVCQKKHWKVHKKSCGVK